MLAVKLVSVKQRTLGELGQAKALTPHATRKEVSNRMGVTSQCRSNGTSESPVPVLTMFQEQRLRPRR
jgi:hypothetical protein